MGESLLRYESLEGFPLQIRKSILDYLVSDLQLLYEEHLEILLDSEFETLDFTGFIKIGKGSKVKDGHLQIIGTKCPRLKEINLSSAPQLTLSGFDQGLAKCHQVRSKEKQAYLQGCLWF